MRTLDGYILRTIAFGIVVSLTLFAAIFAVKGLVDEMDNIGEGAYGLFDAVQFVILQLPAELYQLFPVIVLLGTLISLGNMASGSELIVMRASGVSLLRLAGAALRASLIFAALCFAIGEWVVPEAQQQADSLKSVAHRNALQDNEAGSLWLRDGDSFVYVKRVLSQQVLQGVEVYRFTAGHELQLAAVAESARFEKDAWYLQNVRLTKFAGDQVRASTHTRMRWATNLNPALFKVSILEIRQLSASALRDYLQFLRANGIEAGEYELAFWRKLTVPVMAVLLCMLSVPFVVGPLRSRGAGERVFIGMILGVVCYLLDELTANSGRVYGLNALLTAWLPTVLVGSITLLWLLYVNSPRAGVAQLFRLAAAR